MYVYVLCATFACSGPSSCSLISMSLGPLQMHVALPCILVVLQETAAEIPEALKHGLDLFIASCPVTHIFCNVCPTT